MEEQQKPFMYRLELSGQDLLFKRVIYENVKDASEIGNFWGMYMDLEDPAHCKVLIFANAMKDGGLKREEIMDAINKAQTFVREQIEPVQNNFD